MTETISITGQVEEILIETLKKTLPEFDIESFPVNFQAYTFTSPIGCILVKYVKTSYKEQNTIWNVNQDSVLKFTLIIGLRGLSKYFEMHEPIQKIKDVITGLEIMGRKIILNDDQFLAEINTDLYCGISLNINLWQEE